MNDFIEPAGPCHDRTRAGPDGPGRGRSKILVGRAVGIRGKKSQTPGILPRLRDPGSSGRGTRPLQGLVHGHGVHGEVRGTRMPTPGPARATAWDRARRFNRMEGRIKRAWSRGASILN